MNKHIRSIHEDLKLHKCDRCKKSFGHKYAVKKHIREVHNKDLTIERYFCKVCGKTFTNKKSEKEHYIAIHEGRKYFQCDSCEKSFAIKQNLGNMHNTAKNFQEKDDHKPV